MDSWDETGGIFGDSVGIACGNIVSVPPAGGVMADLEVAQVYACGVPSGRGTFVLDIACVRAVVGADFVADCNAGANRRYGQECWVFFWGWVFFFGGRSGQASPERWHVPGVIVGNVLVLQCCSLFSYFPVLGFFGQLVSFGIVIDIVSHTVDVKPFELHGLKCQRTIVFHFAVDLIQCWFSVGWCRYSCYRPRPAQCEPDIVVVFPSEWWSELSVLFLLLLAFGHATCQPVSHGEVSNRESMAGANGEVVGLCRLRGTSERGNVNRCKESPEDSRRCHEGGKLDIVTFHVLYGESGEEEHFAHVDHRVVPDLEDQAENPAACAHSRAAVAPGNPIGGLMKWMGGGGAQPKSQHGTGRIRSFCVSGGSG